MNFTTEGDVKELVMHVKFHFAHTHCEVRAARTTQPHEGEGPGTRGGCRAENSNAISAQQKSEYIGYILTNVDKSVIHYNRPIISAGRPIGRALMTTTAVKMQ